DASEGRTRAKRIGTMSYFGVVYAPWQSADVARASMVRECVEEEDMNRRAFSKLPPMSQIPRVVDPAPDVFPRYFVSQGAPVVLVASRVFQGVPKSLDEILAGGGDKVPVSVRGGDYLDPDKRRRERVTLGEYVEQVIRPHAAAAAGIDGGPLPPYSGNTPLSKSEFAALGFKFPEPFEGKSFEFPRLWIGPRGSMTP